MSQAIDKLDITVSDDVLDDLRERLARTRWPDQIPNSAWEYGTDLAYLQELCEYWREKFDWRKQEALLKQWDHFKTEIDGQKLHFIHARSSVEGALPLVITHGWPGSVFEFYKIIGPLTDPEAHAGDPADAFHVVCPSMPGYGWSGPTHETGYDIRKVAETVSKLMARLGYERYGAQGGDWGAIATTQLGLVDAEHLAGIHLNMVIAGPPAGVENPMEGVSPEEMEGMAEMGNFQKNETGYQQIQGTKPQTLGYGLTDSPAGLDRREVQDLERLQWRHRESLQQGRAADQHHDLLGDGNDQFVDAPLLRVDAQRPLWSARRTYRRADRLRNLPQGDHPTAAEVGRGPV